MNTESIDELISLLGDIICNVEQYGYLTNDSIDKAKKQIAELENAKSKPKPEPERSAEEIKDRIAQKQGYSNWEEYYDWIAREGQLPSVVAQLIESAMQEATEIYASQFHPKWEKKFITDNESWIYWNLYPMLKEDPKTAIKEFGLDPSHAKMLRKLIKKADKLGWFDGIKRVKEDNPYEGFC